MHLLLLINAPGSASHILPEGRLFLLSSVKSLTDLGFRLFCDLYESLNYRAAPVRRKKPLSFNWVCPY